MRSRELADLLLPKAKHDQFTLEKLFPDPASPNEVIGFHAQQAVAKMLKAVLALRSVAYRPTHNLATLLGLLRQHQISFPAEFEETRRLTPFAAELRYDDLPDDPERPFDRSWALDCVRQVRAWAESLLREQKEGPLKEPG
jgi:HEPN domain-containing protein